MGIRPGIAHATLVMTYSQVNNDKTSVATDFFDRKVGILFIYTIIMF